MGLAGENLDAVHHHQRHRQEGGADPPSFCGILSIRPQNAGWKEHGSIRPARAADSTRGQPLRWQILRLMPYGLDYSTILIMIAISYDVALFFLSFFLFVPRSPSTNRSPNGAAVPSSKRVRLDAVAHWRSPSWVTGGKTGPGPKSEAFRVSNRRVIPFSPSALNTLTRCNTARHETNTSIWVDPHRLQMGRFPVCGGGGGCHPTDRQTEPTILDPVNIYKRGLGIDSVLGLFRRGTKGRIPTWSASWRPFCRLKLGTSPAASPTSIDGVRTSSNWPGTQSPTAHRHLK
ncbi:uncharacterized protein BO87DRAFT_397878 [Aspergillus neoniger CBS 115656]|uniref:Uncharacterized protein n=1 Tax=Aspergillus neoniger (strain CBS 115656) TaxID=1448310 RepID=A0A318YGL4_ASPNB|nr:hypothetical protein BO87DRAFT_397878 [Aspergillus neoniger CBS 115656]PYH33339.1 hypothetical protein BO87DRAFT_397878 [Aspergillus neoniger CBS 115656]